MKQKSVLILSVVTLAALGAAAVALHEGDTAASSGERTLVFPELSAKVNEVAELHIEKAGKGATLKREGGQWKLSDRGGYPAQFEKVKELVVGVADLPIEEVKTAKKENHAKLALQWPAPAVED